MTNDEKAKAYEMALEAARKELGVDRKEWKVVQQVLHNIFPELRESEDERIRKALIDGVRQIRCKNGITQEQMIAYLEKQKEQKPEHFELKAGKWYICHRAFCARADHLTVKEGERFQCEKDGIVKGFVIKEPEKYFKECAAPAPMEDEQKEQKPACGDDFKWTSQDEECRSKLIDVLELADAAYPTTKDSRDELWEWLKELPMKFPNKNAFISGTLDNDDELSQTEEILGVDGNPTCYKQKPAEWSEPRINSKPIPTENQTVDIPLAEWSEEDEDMLNCCISSIEEAKENRYAYKETDGDTSYDREIAFLKSLRPDSYKNCNSRWKPSEEQLNALNFAVTYFMHETNYKNPTELRDLYDDLIKLK